MGINTERFQPCLSINFTAAYILPALFDQATSSNFQIGASSITITSPSSNSYWAQGSTLSVSWTITGPDSGATFTTSLSCPGFTTVISESTSLSTSIDIPGSNYGSNCIVSVSANGYTTSVVPIIVYQTVSFNKPSNGDVIALTTSSIPVKVITSDPTANTSIVTTLQCASNPASISTNNIPTNADGLTISVASDQIGTCTLGLSNSPVYLSLPDPPTIAITLKYTLFFATVPSQVYIGTKFTVRIDTQTAAANSPTVTMYLICPANKFSSSLVNVKTKFNNTYALGYTVSVGTYYYQVNSGATYTSATSSNFTVSLPYITITSPSANSIAPSGTSLPVAWNVSYGSLTYTVSLSCPGFTPPISKSLTARSTFLSINSEYYGSNCNLTVSALRCTSGQENLTVTQSVSFSTPTNGDVIALNTSSIPVKLITSSGNVFANVASTFQCASSSETIYTSNIAANTDGLTLPVTSSQIGTCTLTLTAAPDYLELPTPPSITFTLKYKLIFDMVPSTIYLGESFSTQTNTETPASSTPPVTLSLICPTEEVSTTWADVMINQANTLTMPSSLTYMGSCYFLVNTDATYTSAVSSNVIVQSNYLKITSPTANSQWGFECFLDNRRADYWSNIHYYH